LAWHLGEVDSWRRALFCGQLDFVEAVPRRATRSVLALGDRSEWLGLR